MNCHIRWMIRKDMSEVLDIESKSFRNSMDEDEFLKLLRSRLCIGMVAESIHSDEEVLTAKCQTAWGRPYKNKYSDVLGFMIYELSRPHLTIIDFAIHPDYRRLGIGTELFNRLTSKLDDRRTSLLFPVSEYSDEGLLFLRKMGCVCEDFSRDAGEYTYLMKFRNEWKTQNASSCKEM